MRWHFGRSILLGGLFLLPPSCESGTRRKVDLSAMLPWAMYLSKRVNDVINSASQRHPGVVDRQGDELGDDAVGSLRHLAVQGVDKNGKRLYAEVFQTQRPV